MVAYASVDKNDTLLDIGAGLGFLTRFMADKCKSVQAVEADSDLASILREQVSTMPNVKIIEGDILKVKVPYFNKIVSTPPYNISSRLLLWILNQRFDCAVLVFQKEFADRLIAPVGDRNYGWLTVFTYYHAEAELLDDVPKSMFYPSPKVDSVVTRLTPKKPELRGLEDKVAFKRLVQMFFTERNKKVRGAALSYLRIVQGVSRRDAAQIAQSLPYCEKRVRQLTPEDFGALANALIR